MSDFIDELLVAAKVPLKNLDTYKAFLEYIEVDENTLPEITEQRLERYAKEYTEKVTDFRLGLYAAKIASVAANWGNRERIRTRLSQGTPEKERVQKRMKQFLYPSSGEGVELSDPVITARHQTCEKILDILQERRILLVRAPPFSGKSSLATLFNAFMENLDKPSIKVSMLGFKGNLDDHWLEETGNSWEHWLKSNHVIIIDESQCLYELGIAHNFWQRIKQLMDLSYHSEAKILFFAAYGERPSVQSTSVATPVTFNDAHCLDLNTVRFTTHEYNELLLNCHSTKAGTLVQISGDVSDVIQQSTRKHPGLVRLFFDKINEQFLSGAKTGDVIEDDMIVEYLTSRTFIQQIQNTRAVPNNILNEKELEIIRSLINNESIEIPENIEKQQTILELTKAGIVVKVEDQYQFSAPIIRMIYIQRLFSSVRPEGTLTKDNFSTFLTDCIQNFKSSNLQNSLSKGVHDFLLERQWQMEFYRSVTSRLPERFSISPDVGRVFDSKEYLDFYINSTLHWAIELLREGNRSKEHSARFEKGGIYYIMRNKISHYAILDFRADIPSNLMDNFWYIVYNDDYTRVKILRKGVKEIDLVLLG